MILEYGFFIEDIMRIMVIQLLDVLDYFYKMNIIYCDVKLDNILVSLYDLFVVKFMDFGFFKMIDYDQMFFRIFCGIFLYCVFEVYLEYVEYDSRGRWYF